MKRFRLGFMRKLVLSYTVLVAVFLLILINVAYRYILDVSEKNAAINQEQLMEKTLSQVEGYLSELNSMAMQVSGDTRIINIFSRLQGDYDSDNYFEKDIMDSIEVGSILTSHNGPGSSVWRISLYNQNGDFISSGASVTPQSKVEERLAALDIRGLMRELMLSDTGFLLTPPEEDHWSGTYDATYTSFIRPLTNYYSTEVYGLVEVQQGLDSLENSIALEVLTDITVFVFDAEGNQILPQKTDFRWVDHATSFITRSRSETYGWSVALVQSRAQITAPFTTMIWYLYFGGIGVLVLLFVAIYVIARQLSKPIVGLSNKVRAINIANIPTDLEAGESTDEIRELGDAFTAMLKKLNDSIAYEKRSYLLALQSQMDPHFLYNSLSIISSMGVEAGSDKIVDACDKLSSMLRYSASYDVLGTVLRDEIDNVQNYLELMKLRFEAYFSYTVQVDDGMGNMPMPRLILQPIVENCFEHGFKEVPPPWHVSIMATRNQTHWRITIADNGGGFTSESLREMERRIEAYSKDLPKNYHEMKIGGLGLVNTIIRLKLSMNDHVVYSIEANQPTGTIVTLEGEIHDSGSDRGR